MDSEFLRKVYGSFCDIEEEKSSFEFSKFLILSIPYEQTTSYKSGTKEGPGAIIDASRYVELYDEELGKNSSEAGIYTLGEVVVDYTGPEKMTERIYKTAQKIVSKEKVLMSLGGEHSVTPGIVRAYKELYPDLSVLQLDAHADLRQEYEGTPFSHASAVRRVLDWCPAVQVGIRSISPEEVEFLKTTEKTKIFYAHKLLRNLQAQLDEITDSLSENVYITLDLDVLDPSIMPSVGTPEPGGLLWYDILDILKHVASKKNIVGVDVVELMPQSGSIASDFLTAKLIYKLIGYINN